VEVTEVNKNRLSSLQLARDRFGGQILLKGFRSLIADSEGSLRLIGAGGPVLAKAGTGDVLAGFIGGFLAAGMVPVEALSLACYLHGKIGDIYGLMWKNDFTMLASDLIEWLPSVVRGLNAKAKAP
jgi:NAD(P)H-hydrate epimerase